ncbi:hypothetical protein GCM10018779_21580 [Streptomyces griseocarneus]|nr:hypothetical protein GCM10018779_21580 [Streptomyces griseocarneus]
MAAAGAATAFVAASVAAVACAAKVSVVAVTVRMVGLPRESYGPLSGATYSITTKAPAAAEQTVHCSA